MYITKQSLLLLSITLYSQEYITVRVPRCVFGSAFVLVGLFLERFPHQFGRFRKQDFFSGRFPRTPGSWRQTAGKKTSECSCNFALINNRRKLVAYCNQIVHKNGPCFPLCKMLSTRHEKFKSPKYKILTVAWCCLRCVSKLRYILEQLP